MEKVFCDAVDLERNNGSVSTINGLPKVSGSTINKASFSRFVVVSGDDDPTLLQQPRKNTANITSD